MSILSDTSIREALASGALAITPLLDGAIRASSVDLRLGPLLMIADPNEPDGWRVHDLRERPFRLYHGSFVLAATLESVTLPADMAGILAGKSSRAREGLILENAGWVDPGWEGELTVELANLHPGYLLLELGLPIGQIMFMTTTTPCERPYGHPELRSHYHRSRGPVPSRDTGRRHLP